MTGFNSYIDGLDLSALNEYCVNHGRLSSRWDRYLGMTAPMTQVPVPTAISAYRAEQVWQLLVALRRTPQR